MSCELCETEVGVTSHTSKYYVPRSILEKERERSRKLVEALEKYTEHSTYKGAAVGDYVPCSIAFEAIAEYEKSREDD